MRKTFFLLMCIVGLITSCSQDDSVLDRITDTNLRSQKIRWYGVKNSDAPQTRGVADKVNLWNTSVGIPIKFLNTPSDPTMIEKIKTIAREWEQYAGIKFNFVDSDQNATVRIAFDWNGNDLLTWSYTGTNAKFVKNQSEPTAVFGGLEYLSEEEFKGDVLRLFGQILGLEYEQRHQDWSFWKSEAQLQRYWESMFEGMDINWEDIREYVFTPLTGENAIYPTQTAEIDEFSVMAWPYYNTRQTAKIWANYELSEGDKAFIGTLYPKEKSSLPTIQEAWVDAGYFTWTDDTKTSLRITALGAEQDTLPDVCDGEQLTSAKEMFFYLRPPFLYDGSRLRSVPQFNTSNITDFSRMFNYCLWLTSVPLLDTSKGTSFEYMFLSCSLLTTVPLLNTSNGTNFMGMFGGCSSLITIPLLDTSNGTDFGGMFEYCKSLARLPLLDTSNGADFEGMFSTCTSLTTIPELNTSSGINFHRMFEYCRSLTTVPLLDTSNGTNFRCMFEICESLIAVPHFNTSNGTDFGGMFASCEALETIPLLDTSNGTDFSGMYGGMFANCTSLTSVPLINTSKGINFYRMFEGCTSLVTIPKLNTSSGTNFSRMFSGCTSLVTIPMLDTSKGICFGSIINMSNANLIAGGMFEGCIALTTIPLLDTSNGTYFSGMFADCASLTSIPLIDTSNGIYFGSSDYQTNSRGMFENCISLTTIPQLNTSSGTTFAYMFKGCTSLAEKPNLNLSKAKDTKEMYLGTRFQ